MSQSSQKSGAIQALRALAILSVLGFHLNSKWIPNGFLGVDMFFVISGYLMTLILTKSGISISTTKKFFERRIKRILPLYLITVLSVLCGGHLFLTAKDYRILIFDALWSLGIVSNMQSLFHQYNYFEELTSYKLLTHTWSLSVELQYYLFVPLLMLLLLYLRYSFRILVICTFGSLSFLLQQIISPSISFSFLPGRVWQFFFGTLVYELSKSNESNEKGNYKLLNVNQEADSLLKEDDGDKIEIEVVPSTLFDSHLLCVLSFLCALSICFISTGNTTLDRFMATSFAAIVIYFSSFGPTPVLDIRPIQYIGDISYVLYLSHWPIIVFLKYISFEEEITTKTALLAVFLTIVVSVIIHHTLEQLFIDNGFFYSVIWIGCLYLCCILIMIIPNEDIDLSNYISPLNSTKNCRSLSVDIPWPKMDKYEKLHNGFEKYGEASGNGTFNILLLGNSFMRMSFPWFYKALHGRFKNLTVHAVSTCLPFVHHSELHSSGAAYKNCDHSLQQDIELAKKLKPKIIFVSIGYRTEVQLTVYNETEDVIVENALRYLNVYSNLTDFIVLDTPLMEISASLADKLERISRGGLKPMDRNQSHFSYDAFLKKHKHTLRRIESIQRRCSKCRFIEIQSEFCDGYFCDTYDYDCGKSLFTTDGIHFTAFAKNLIYHRYKASIDTIMQLAGA